DGGTRRRRDVETRGRRDEGTEGRRDGGTERGGEIRTRILSVSRSPCPFVPSSPRLPASPPLHLRRGQRGKGDELQCALRGDEQAFAGQFCDDRPEQHPAQLFSLYQDLGVRLSDKLTAIWPDDVISRSQ